jgi:hypothetical protein
VGDRRGALLRPGGRLYVRDCHPVLFTLDDERSDGVLAPVYPYFETVEPLVLDSPETYTDGDVSTRVHTRTAEWNHGLGEVVTALVAAGLRIDVLAEHTVVDWRALPHMVDAGGGRWRLPDEQHGMVPLMFSVQATRTG